MKVVEYDSSDEEDARSNSITHVDQRAIMAQRQRLPMYRGRAQVAERIMANQVTVVIGETGSGKSTQLPQVLLATDPAQRIAITQPRRVAAINLARRVSDEMGTKLGDIVGYQVRFKSLVGRNTRLRYATDGMLMREVMIDPELRKYSTIVVDEAHERTVVTDLLLGILKGLLQRRPKLRVVIMSATLDADKFSAFFGNAPILYVEGKTFPVERFYLKSAVDSVVEATVSAVCMVNVKEPTGDILVFLPGQEEIDAAVDQLTTIAAGLPKNVPRLLPLPLYAALPEHKQQKVFDATPRHYRKVVLATNIAETSLTISGVRYVIDSGLRKVRIYRSKLGMDSLLPAPISQSSAMQRMGRAGREAPGKCFRLFTEKTYREMVSHTEPEIARVAVATPVLMLKNAGVDNVMDFDWLEAPSARSIANALLQLYSLKALDDNGRITSIGKQMVVLPVEPQLAAVLIHAKSQPLEIRDTVIDIAACLSVQDLLVTPPVAKRSEVSEARAELFPLAFQYGDLALIKQIYDSFKKVPKNEVKFWCSAIAVNPRALRGVGLVKSQLRRYLSVKDHAEDFDNVDYDEVIKCFLQGYVTNTAVGLPDRRYQTIMMNQPVSIHPSSTMFGKRAPAIMYLEYIFTNKGYARIVSPIELDWLREVAPHFTSRS